ncbi:fatty acyl-AMP ligase [Streptomyces sp. OfavH-34-F]|uniref:fatty acyl-AMP ligase n=1 Tax=Streptomyces sp. OfavH-34-F TaxID=2917760 RepID=UPI001EF3A783|nr:fatty acyl-AMP ligase [Streptomyces sp. OfavH-34-F]MCG7524505.1 fatty acyl-AMP ligase [Streptomyces sp. OfavH-34-F]
MSESRFATFTELLRARTAELAGQDVHVFLRDTADGPVAEHLTYGELDREARRIAACLQSYGVTEQPVLLAYSSTVEFLKGFAGCLYAGAVAVPVPLPGEAGRDKRLNRTTAVLKDTGAAVVLTETSAAPEVALWLARNTRNTAECLVTDVPEIGDPEAWRPVAARADDLVFLQYTSGSVSEPRGVTVSHRNLLANQASLQKLLGTTREDVFGSWLPYFHDMGLVAHLLHPIHLGSHSVQVTPLSFVKRPLRWLQAIDEYGVTVGGGPNFCYDLCVHRVKDEQIAALDLSRWRLALNGAEPVRAESLDAFAERFAPAGFRPEALRPCYGLAEATLVVSGGAPGTPYVRRAFDQAELERDRAETAGTDGRRRTLVGCGVPVDADVRIVDPLTHHELPAGAVGEIWIRGYSVARGYWRRPTETVRTFRASLNDEESNFLRTGDLGMLVDGELFVTGRLKEVIIINGRNVYPQDVEWAARTVSPALTFGAGAAFSVDAGREHLVLVQEVRGVADSTELRTVAQKIQALIGQEFEIPAGNILLVRPGAVRRTSSGKVQRTLMRTLFLDGVVRGEYEVLTPDVWALARAEDVLFGGDLLRPEGADGGRRW